MLQPKIVLLLLLPLASRSLAQDVEHELPYMPKAFATALMWNIKMTPAGGNPPDSKPITMTYSMAETVDDEKFKSMVEVLQEANIDTDMGPMNIINMEKIIWQPGVSGVNSFLYLTNLDSGDLSEIFCMADSAKTGGFLDFLFGFDLTTGEGYPSVTHMLHWGEKNYTYVQDTVVNGIEVMEFAGHWDIPTWKTTLEVKYYWTNLGKWQSTSGTGVSVPVSVVLQGRITSPNGGGDFTVNMNIEYASFYEVSMPDSFYAVQADLWCDGRQMPDHLPRFNTDHFTYDSELVFSFINPEGRTVSIIAPRTEWYDHNMLVSRAEYQPPDLEHKGNPYNNPNGKISEIHDFTTGLLYSIDETFGNCTIEFLDDSADGIDHHGHGHIHMMNPFYNFFMEDTWAYNGEYSQRGFQVDSFIRTAPLPECLGCEPHPENFTTVIMLTASSWEIENQEDQERLIPAKVIRYPTMDYNNNTKKLTANYYNFRTHSASYQKYDISPCFPDDQNRHFMIRLGYSIDMDLEETVYDFYKETRASVTIFGKVTPIRVVNIEADVDHKNSALFVIFTVVDYPRQFAVELGDFPDAVRSMDEVESNLRDAVDSGDFIIMVGINDGKGGHVIAKAEKGSLTVLTNRSQDYSYKDGYSSSDMAWLGVVLLLVSIVGFGALLVFVLKL